jgi:hypothetical protein
LRSLSTRITAVSSVKVKFWREAIRSLRLALLRMFPQPFSFP